MSIKETLLKAKRNVRTRVLGRGTDIEPAVICQGILARVQSQIVEDAGARVFPFGRIVIRLQPQTREQSGIVDESLLNGTLKSNIVQMLREAHVRFPNELETIVEFQPRTTPYSAESSPESAFEMDFFRSEAVKKPDAPEAKLQILKGVTEKPEYVLKKSRILVGRSPEVLDREGRIVRRNDIVFLENEEETNLSVGRTHARIWFDPDRNEFFILDEGSRYGTRILRSSAVIEVSGAEPDGIALQSGDEIYCGQACIRFTLR